MAKYAKFPLVTNPSKVGFALDEQRALSSGEGLSSIRKRSKSPYTKLQVGWELMDEEFKLFEYFYRTIVQRGMIWFGLLLPIPQNPVMDDTGVFCLVKFASAYRVAQTSTGFTVTVDLDWDRSRYLTSADLYVPDLLFANVLLLCNGDGLLVDSSNYHRSLSSSGGIALNTTYTLNGAPTYYVPTSGRLINTDGGLLGPLLGNGEWCQEFYLRPISPSPFGIYGGINYWPAGVLSLSPGNALQLDISIGGVTDAIAIALTGATFQHVSLIRDNTSHPTYSRIHLTKNGTTLATTAANFPKASNLDGVVGSYVMGYDLNSPTVAFGGMRLTRLTRRYLTNTVGTIPNTFTPDSYPFPTG